MSTPAISIVVIVYNGLPFLKECIQSVLDQDEQDWQLLISDDGSTDGSRDYLDTLSDKRIQVYKQQSNLGIFGNLNFLFGKATAPLSQILCQDDHFTDRRSLTKILRFWSNAEPQIGFIRFNHHTKLSKKLVGYETRIVPRVIKAGEADPWFYVFGNIPGNLSNLSLRTNIVAECGWFKDSLPFAGDFDFWSRAARKVDMAISSDVVAQIRSHPRQASHYLNYNGELVAQKVQVINSLYTHVIEKYSPSNFLIKLHGTLNYDSLERDMALKVLLKGNSRYMKQLNEHVSATKYTFPLVGRWILYIMSIGGRFGRVFSAKWLLKDLGKKI